MNREKIKVNTQAGMLEHVAPKRHPFKELLEWLRREKNLSAHQLAERSGLFSRAALTMQSNKENPNPGLDIIHGIAKVAGLPEQVICDACLGRPFPKGHELQEELLKEVLRKYQMIRPENRGNTLEYTLWILNTLIDETLEAQEKTTHKR